MLLLYKAIYAKLYFYLLIWQLSAWAADTRVFTL